MQKTNHDACKCARMPIMNEPAPEFGAETTHGYVDFPRDYRGKWVVFFSHPGDFTPVCTTEFMTFQSMVDEFRAMNTELLGLSVDSVPSHLAWANAIKNDVTYLGWKNMEITFPIVADSGAEIATQYGMLAGGGRNGTVRAVFIIDPRGIVRAILYYPQSVGRNITEIKRIVIALQVGDAFRIATPAEWIPGEDVIVPAPRTSNDMKTKRKSSTERNWFLNFKPLSPEAILEKITGRKFITNTKKKKK